MKRSTQSQASAAEPGSRSSLDSWRGLVLKYGTPLCALVLLGALPLAIGFIYKEDLRQAGLLSISWKALSLIPLVVAALFTMVAIYRGGREGDSTGEPLASRFEAGKRAILVTLIFVVFPAIPVFIVLFRGMAEISSTTVILYFGVVLSLQLLWPLVFRRTCDSDLVLERDLKARVLHLARASGVSVRDLVVTKADEDDDEDNDPNAFICGLGPSRLVVIEGELVALLEPKELDAVVAHEFAHGSEHHVAKKLAMIFALTASFVVVRRLTTDTPEGVLLLLSTFALCAIVKLAFDRRLEFAADRQAAEWAGAPNLASALAKLGAASPKPSRIPSWLATHPPIAKRIGRLEAMSQSQ